MAAHANSSVRRFSRQRIVRTLGATALLAAVLSVAGACRSFEDEASLDRERYIDIYVEILRARAGAPDTAVAVDSTTAVLARHGVTEDDLDEFAWRHADDPGFLASAWGEIATRLREPQRQDSARHE